MLADEVDPAGAASNENRGFVLVFFFEQVYKSAPSLLLLPESFRWIKAGKFANDRYRLIHGVDSLYFRMITLSCQERCPLSRPSHNRAPCTHPKTWGMGKRMLVGREDLKYEIRLPAPNIKNLTVNTSNTDISSHDQISRLFLPRNELAILRAELRYRSKLLKLSLYRKFCGINDFNKFWTLPFSKIKNVTIADSKECDMLVSAPPTTMSSALSTILFILTRSSNFTLQKTHCDRSHKKRPKHYCCDRDVNTFS